MYEEQYPAPQSPQGPMTTAPRPFGEIPQLWLQVLQMTEDFFAQEAPRASASNTLFSILIMAGISTVLAIISTLVGGGIQAALLPPESRGAAVAGVGAGITTAICSGLIGTIIGFYLGNGITFLCARLFGGTGDYNTQTYLVSLFAVPIGIVSGALAIIPCVGLIAALGVSIYAIVLNVRAVKVSHNLTTGKAVAAVFLPVVVVFVLVGCLFALLMFMGPGIEGVFDEIINNLESY